jgi:predicted transcriptional regulator
MATNDKRTMTLNLTDREMTALDDLAGRKDLSKTQIIRQAIRLYQTVETRLEKGEKLFFEDEEKKSKSELMMI